MINTYLISTNMLITIPIIAAIIDHKYLFYYYSLSIILLSLLFCGVRAGGLCCVRVDILDGVRHLHY